MSEAIRHLTRASIAVSFMVPLLSLVRKRSHISARVQYALWLLVALRLLLPFVEIGVPVIRASGTGTNAAGQRFGALPTTEVKASSSGKAESNTQNLERDQWGEAAHTRLVYGVWLAGAFATAIYSTCVSAAHRRRLRSARVRGLSASEQALYVSLCARLGIRRMPDVAVCEPLNSPCLNGFLRPNIALSLEAVSPENLEDVFSHELSHLLAGDPLWSLVRCACVSLYWFHPLVWVGATACLRAGEAACDARVVATRNLNGRIDYGRTLLRLARRSPRPRALMHATAMQLNQSNVKERIEGMLATKRSSRAATLSLVTAAILCTLATFAVAEPTPVKEEPTIEVKVTDMIEEETEQVTEPHTEEEAYVRLARKAVKDYLGVDLDEKIETQYADRMWEMSCRIISFDPVDEQIYRVAIGDDGIHRVYVVHMGEPDFAEGSTASWAEKWGEPWVNDNLPENGLEMTGEAGSRITEIEREADAYLQALGIPHLPWVGTWEIDTLATDDYTHESTDLILCIRYPNGSGIRMLDAGSSVDVGYSLYSKKIAYIALVRDGNG